MTCIDKPPVRTWVASLPPNDRTSPMRTLLSAFSTCLALFVACWSGGCAADEYGVENAISLPPAAPAQVWAVAPALNLSGEVGVDPLLQADLLYGNLQAVGGITALPVNRVAEAYLLLGLTGVSSPEDAAAVCDLLGADALVVPTVTLYNPYDPPTMAAALQVFPGRGSVLRPVALAGCRCRAWSDPNCVGEHGGGGVAVTICRRATDDPAGGRLRLPRRQRPPCGDGVRGGTFRPDGARRGARRLPCCRPLCELRLSRAALGADGRAGASAGDDGDRSMS